MGKRIICDVSAILLGLFIFFSFFKAAIFNNCNNRWVPVADTIDQSRRKGLLVSILDPVPKRIELRKGNFEIIEAWIEADAATEYILAWFPYYKKTSYCYLCLRIHLIDQNIIEDKLEFVYDDGETKYFSQIISENNREIFCWKLCASSPICPRHVKIEAKSLLGESKVLTLTIQE